MSVLVTGGTGFVGRFIVEHLIGAGFDVAVAGRTPPRADTFSRVVPFLPLTLDPGGPEPSMLSGITHLVHAAFDHVPGRYRGGEGEAPDRFRRLNLEGSLALFRAARQAGARSCVFLSSRAVYGVQPTGAVLCEETLPRPDTLYGEVKLAAERKLADMASAGFSVASLRITGVYGRPAPDGTHKWVPLFANYLDGKAIEPRCGTEVHGRDVARAVTLMLEATPTDRPATFNVSDLLIDRRDILAILREEAGSRRELPPAANHAVYNPMSSAGIRTLGWTPGGRPLFEATVRQLARDFLSRRKSG